MEERRYLGPATLVDESRHTQASLGPAWLELTQPSGSGGHPIFHSNGSGFHLTGSSVLHLPMSNILLLIEDLRAVIPLAYNLRSSEIAESDNHSSQNGYDV